ncbi:MAG: S9 family peptidase [Bryobacteraceae bacterium]
MTRTLLLLFCACLPAATRLEEAITQIFGKNEFEAKSAGPIRWLDDSSYTLLEKVDGGQNLVRHDAATGAREVLVKAAQITPKGSAVLKVENYEWSKDRKRLLIFTNAKKVWRDNTRGDYWVLDLASSKLRKLGGPAPASSLLFARFSPDGSRVAYVRENDLWVEDASTGRIRRLTHDGSQTVINGTSDWVNEEELSLRDCFRWSPDGSAIAYWQFDTSKVGVFSLADYSAGPYPAIARFPYPKVGTTNAATRVGVVPAKGGKTRWVTLPGDPREHYVPLLEWAESSRDLILHQLNRKQNILDVFRADRNSGRAERLMREQEETWVDAAAIVSGGIRWIRRGKEFLWMSERDGWRHVYAVSRDGREVRLLTRGEFDVIGIAAVDDKQLYFTASPDNATQRYLYRVDLDSSGTATRVTPANAPGTHSYRISPSAEWAVHTWSRFDSPPRVDVVRLPSHESARMIEENQALREKAGAPEPTEFFRVDVGDGVALDAWMIKPPDFDPSRKYPLLVHVYGEPAGVTVTDAWAGPRTLFHRVLAREGYLVASFDNRGTPAPRGRAWRRAGYGSIGVLSSKDQAAAVLALVERRSYVDHSRVAIWGWSGGGSNTLNAMFRFPNLYRVGMSVAPVPDQKLYDTIYQERYMGLPAENENGYKEGSPIHFAEGLQGRLLVVHGSGDDNVHAQGTERLVDRLIALGKRFDLMIYPNRTHSISEFAGTSEHIHQLLARYLVENMPPR